MFTAICFGIGAGAILQVIIEVAMLIVRREGQSALASASGLGGVAGLALMYATALLVWSSHRPDITLLRCAVAESC